MPPSSVEALLAERVEKAQRAAAGGASHLMRDEDFLDDIQRALNAADLPALVEALAQIAALLGPIKPTVLDQDQPPGTRRWELSSEQATAVVAALRRAEAVLGGEWVEPSSIRDDLEAGRSSGQGRAELSVYPPLLLDDFRALALAAQFGAARLADPEDAEIACERLLAWLQHQGKNDAASESTTTTEGKPDGV